MSYNELLINRVRERFSSIPQTEEKRMFGGRAFIVNEKLCVCVRNNNVMFRIDPALHNTHVEKEGCLPMNIKGKPYVGYVIVDEEVMKADEDLDYWINLSLEFNERAQASKKRSS